MVSTDEIIFYLKFPGFNTQWRAKKFSSKYSDQRKHAFLWSDNGLLENFAKSMNEDENLNLKNKALPDGWISIASKVYRHKNNSSSRFEDWLYKECIIKKQTSYNYRMLYKLTSVAPKLMNCRVNTTNFVKNHLF